MSNDYKSGYRVGYNAALEDCARIIADVAAWREQHPDHTNEQEQAFEEQYFAAFTGGDPHE